MFGSNHVQSARAAAKVAPKRLHLHGLIAAEMPTTPRTMTARVRRDTMTRLLVRTFPLATDLTPASEVAIREASVMLVTGPQRSGTTFAAAAFAQQLAWAFVGERAFGMRNSTRLLAAIAAATRPTVYHLPALSHEVHTLAERMPPSRHVVVIFVARDCWDVEASERSVTYGSNNETWTCHEAPRERRNFEKLSQFFEPTDPICIVKQRVWQRLQKDAVDRTPGWRAYTVGYDTLETFAAAGAWRNASERKHFASHQIARQL